MKETSSARDRILATALRLFYRDGIRATGVDRIIAEYWMGWFTAAVEHRFEERGLAAIADALSDWCAEEDFRGCAFINTVAETGGEFPAAIDHKRELEAYVRSLAERLALPSPAVVAAKAMILIEGMTVRAQMGAIAGGPGGLAEIAAQMFTDLTQSSR